MFAVKTSTTFYFSRFIYVLKLGLKLFIISPGWPRLNWFITENLSKPSKDWVIPTRQTEEVPAYIEVSGQQGHIKHYTIIIDFLSS